MTHVNERFQPQTNTNQCFLLLIKARYKLNFCALGAFLWLTSVLNAEGAHAAVEVAAVDAH